MLVPGTYTKMKIVSFPNNGYGRNYALFDCSITLEEGGESGIVPLYYKTNSGKMLNFVSEIPEGYTGISHIWKDSERSEYIRGMYFDKNTAYKEFDLPYNMESFDDLTNCFISLDLVGEASVSDAHTGSIKLRLGEVLPFTFSTETDHIFGAWKVTTPATPTADGERQHTCVICGYTETEIIDNGVPLVSAAIRFNIKQYNSGSLGFTVEVEDKSNILRYDVFLSEDGGNSWGTRFGYAMTDGSLDKTSLTMSIAGVESLTPGRYDAVKIISVPSDTKNYKANSVILDCDIFIEDGGEFDGLLKFSDTGSSEYTVEYVGFDDSCLIKGAGLWDDQNMTTMKFDAIEKRTAKSFTLNKAHVGDISGYYYKVYQLTGTFTEEKIDAVLYSSPLRACELSAEPTTLDVPNGCTFSLDYNGNICATLDMDGKNTEGALNYNVLLKPDNVDSYATFGAISADKVGESAVMNPRVLNDMSFKTLRVRANPGTNADYLENTVDFGCDVTGVIDTRSSLAATFTKVDEGIRVDFAGLATEGTMPTLLLYDVEDTKQQIDYTLVSELSHEYIIISGIEKLKGISYYIEQYINTIEEGTPQKVVSTRKFGEGLCLPQVAAASSFEFTGSDFPTLKFTVDVTTGITGYLIYISTDNENWHYVGPASGKSVNLADSNIPAGSYKFVKIVSCSDAQHSNNEYIGACDLTVTNGTQLAPVTVKFEKSGNAINANISGLEIKTYAHIGFSLDKSRFFPGEGKFAYTGTEGTASVTLVSDYSNESGTVYYLVRKISDVKTDGTTCSYTVSNYGDWQEFRITEN